MGFIDTVKDAAILVQKADNIDLYRALIQVQQEALGLIQEKAELIEENQRLRTRILELEARAAARTEMTMRDGKYFADGDPEPFCPLCWEAKQLAVHLARYQNQPGYFCRQCKSGVR